MTHGRGLGRVVLIGIFVLFTVAGGWLAIAGRGETQLVGVVCLLFFGLGGVGYVAAKFKGDGPGLRVGSVTWNGAQVRALVVPVRPVRWLTAMIGLFGMGAASLLMGLGHLVTVRRGPPRLALLPEGVTVTGGISASWVPWDVVEHVRPFELAVRRAVQRMVSVGVTDPAAVRRPRLSRLLTMGNRYFYGADVVYVEDDYRLTAEQLQP